MDKETFMKIILNILVVVLASLITWAGTTFFNNQISNQDFKNSISSIAKDVSSFRDTIERINTKMDAEQKLTDSRLVLLDKQISLIELRMKNLEDTTKFK